MKTDTSLLNGIFSTHVDPPCIDGKDQDFLNAAFAGLGLEMSAPHVSPVVGIMPLGTCENFPELVHATSFWKRPHLQLQSGLSPVAVLQNCTRPFLKAVRKVLTPNRTINPAKSASDPVQGLLSYEPNVGGDGPPQKKHMRRCSSS